MKNTLLTLTSTIIISSTVASHGAENELAASLTTPSNWSMGVYGGTTGAGLNAQYEVRPWLKLKAEAGGLSYSDSIDLDEVNYDADLDIFAAGATADINPFSQTPVAKGLRLSLGAYAVNNTINVTASSPGQVIEIGDALPYTLQAGDSLTGDVSFNSLAPYAGLGWDFMFGKEDQFAFSLDVGVLFTGSPEVNLTPNSALLDKIDISEFNVETESLRDEADVAKYYPVVKLGFNWKF